MDSEIEGFVTAFVLLNKAERNHFEFLAHKCKKWALGIWHNVNSVVEKGTSASVCVCV